MSSILHSIQLHKYLSTQLKLCLLILERYNCRAGEVLGAQWINYHKDHFLILKGQKKSQDIIIRDMAILEMIGTLPRLSKTFLFPSVTYSILYHTVKKDYSHLFVKFKTKNNNKVTHGFRYIAANLSKDQDTVKTILHHNSLKSGLYYNKDLPDPRKKVN